MESRKDLLTVFYSRADDGGDFDMSILRQAGIVFPDVPATNIMQDFAKIYGAWNEYYQDYTYQKLSTAAQYYGYEYNASDSLADVRATLFVYNAMRASERQSSK